MLSSIAELAIVHTVRDRQLHRESADLTTGRPNTRGVRDGLGIPSLEAHFLDNVKSFAASVAGVHDSLAAPAFEAEVEAFRSANRLGTLLKSTSKNPAAQDAYRTLTDFNEGKSISSADLRQGNTDFGDEKTTVLRQNLDRFAQAKWHHIQLEQHISRLTNADATGFHSTAFATSNENIAHQALWAQAELEEVPASASAPLKAQQVQLRSRALVHAQLAAHMIAAREKTDGSLLHKAFSELASANRTALERSRQTQALKVLQEQALAAKKARAIRDNLPENTDPSESSLSSTTFLWARAVLDKFHNEANLPESSVHERLRKATIFSHVADEYSEALESGINASERQLPVEKNALESSLHALKTHIGVDQSTETQLGYQHHYDAGMRLADQTFTFEREANPRNGPSIFNALLTRKAYVLQGYLAWLDRAITGYQKATSINRRLCYNSVDRSRLKARYEKDGDWRHIEKLLDQSGLPVFRSAISPSMSTLASTSHLPDLSLAGSISGDSPRSAATATTFA